MKELIRDIKNRNLGMRPAQCKICGAEGNFQFFLVREMMQNTRDEFEYFVCESCGCLQIKEVPDDLERYYGADYYSFSMKEEPDKEYEHPVTNQEKILDVGCGSGIWLVDKAMQGWGNLHGCDPFLEKDLHYGDRVSIKKCSIHEVEGAGTFDKIRMSDSFEHMTDPLEALKSAEKLLKPGGELIMHIPVYPNMAFEMFETHWYQLDAPRHIFLHSRESLQYLAEQSGLKMEGMRYDSNNTQILRSFFYQHGIPFRETTWELVGEYFSKEDIFAMDRTIEMWNEKGQGDQAVILWRKQKR